MKLKYTKKEKKFIDKDFKKMCVNYKYTPSILPACDRIVVFGDIHGDLKLTIEFLTQSNVASYDYGTKKATWTGGRTCCVQVGDQVDRCRFTTSDQTCNNPKTTLNDEANDIVIMELFNDLNISICKSNNISFVCSVSSTIFAYVKFGLIFSISFVLTLNFINFFIIVSYNLFLFLK